MQSTNSLTWVDQEDPAAPIAPFVLNFVTDTIWQFKTSDGFYLQRRINPHGVMVDNTPNAFNLTVAFGPLSITVPGNSRQPVTFPAGVDYVTFTSPVAAGTCAIAFYIVEPAAGATGIGQPSQFVPATEGGLFNGASPPANGLSTLQTVAGNKNGLIIRRAILVFDGNSNLTLFCDTVAPASALDFTKRAIISSTATAGKIPFVVILPYPLKFPAGFGIFIFCSAGGTNDAFGVSWDLL